MEVENTLVAAVVEIWSNSAKMLVETCFGDGGRELGFVWGSFSGCGEDFQ